MDEDFFDRNAEIVARELLGCELVMGVDGAEKRAKIVETEAYFGSEDPASRACQNGDLRETMKMGGGTILVYGVHNNWLVNFVTGSEGEASAVLIRAVEPLNFEGRCSGPGLLTKGLGIDKSLHKARVIGHEGMRVVRGDFEDHEVVEGFRIGVKKDLDKPMRFYIKGNKHVSRK